jgi:structural maintenance of chromosome 3 (chondroitin sulfate proteoglycan 6)
MYTIVRPKQSYLTLCKCGFIEELNQKLEGAKSFMQTLSKRLEELAQEKNDLEAFTSLDRTRRALEYCLYESRLKATMEELEAVS